MSTATSPQSSSPMASSPTAKSPMANLPPEARSFLFLQGPHGPFFGALGKLVKSAGAQVHRVGFNAGDQMFWPDRASYVPYQGAPEDWPARFTELCDTHDVTDIVLYGDTRPIHAQAVEIASNRGLTVHVFEEGYLRPYWVTYERGGANGHSRLMEMSVAEMEEALARTALETPLPPAHWGDTRQHVIYGALYHWFVMFANRAYRKFRPHRALTVTQEFKLYVRRLLLMPLHGIERRLATARIRNGGFPYHLALLQLEHDSAFQQHSPFEAMEDFLEEVVRDFAKGAPRHHHLVVKAHPLEDGRAPIRRSLRQLATKYEVGDRLHFVRGGKLAQLLNEARTAVTVNSTAGQQVLWRGLPLRVFGKAVYAKPEFVSDQPLAEFFATPARPDGRAYKQYRRFLLETSQLPGGFYSRSGRRQLLRQVVDMMLAPDDPYGAFLQGTAAPRQHLRALA